jgi:hypothetical protein
MVNLSYTPNGFSLIGHHSWALSEAGFQGL